MSDATEVGALVPVQRMSLMARFAERFQIEPDKLAATLKATAFNTSTPITNEQLAMLVIVANQYNLNPFTRQIYAYPDKGRIVPVVGVDGWIHLVQSHPQFDGYEFEWDEDEGAMTCTIHRKDRRVPTEVTEYLAECRRGTDPWTKMPRRMMRNRALAQCARLAFGFAGIHTEDEAEAIVAPRTDSPQVATDTAARVKQAVKKPTKRPAPPVEEVTDVEPEQPMPSRLSEFRARLVACTSDDDAQQVLQEGSAFLNADEVSALDAVYRANFQPTPKDEE